MQIKCDEDEEVHPPPWAFSGIVWEGLTDRGEQLKCNQKIPYLLNIVLKNHRNSFKIDEGKLTVNKWMRNINQLKVAII